MSASRAVLWVWSSLPLLAATTAIAGDAGGLACSATQLDRVTRDASASGDEFGRAVALDRTRAVVGAHLADDAGTNAGAASVFEPAESGVAWTEIAQLTASDAAANDNFGSAVAVDGDIIVVGAEREGGVGAVYIFQRDETTLEWNEIFKITPPDGGAGDRFGGAVAVRGTTVVVGAHQHDGGTTDGGAIYVFDRAAGPWTLTQKMGPGSAGDSLGFAVEISGDTIMASAPGFGSDGRGSVHFYELSTGPTTPWIPNGIVTAPDGADDDFFGRSIGLDGDQAIAGAFRDDDACAGDPGCDSGSAWIIFRVPDGGFGTWAATQKLTPADGGEADLFGYSVDISGSNAVVAALHADDACPGNPSCNSGSAYAFLRNAGGLDAWGEATELTAIDGALGDSLGRDIAISGATVLAGAHRTDDVGSNSGAAYLFALETACGCPADLDVDASIGFSDLVQLLSEWGDCECAADFDGDGAVGFGDLIFLLALWGPCD